MILNNENEKVWITYITDVSRLNTNKFVLNDSIEKLGVCVLRINYDTNNNKYNDYANDILYRMLSINKKVKNPINYLIKKTKERDEVYAKTVTDKLDSLLNGDIEHFADQLLWVQDDQKKWFQFNVITVARIAGNISMMVSIVEVTDMQNLKESLKVKNHQLESAFKLTKSQVAVFLKNRPLVSIQSKNFIEKFKVQPEDYVKHDEDTYEIDWNKCVQKYVKISENKLELIRSKINGLIEGKEDNFEYFDDFIYRGSGFDKLYYYRLACSLQPDGNVMMVLSDITESHSKEVELKRVKKMFDYTVESANIGSFYIDLDKNPNEVFADDISANLIGVQLNDNKTYDLPKWFDSDSISELDGISLKDEYYKMINKEIDSTEFTFGRLVNGEQRYIRAIVSNIQSNANNEVIFIPGVLVDVTKLIESERKVYEQSIIDVVTKGYNRNKYIGDLEHGHLNDRFVVYGNINRFQHVNDFYGHEIGDWYLKETAHRLAFDGRFVVYRIGADDFTLVAIKEVTYEEFKVLQKDLRDGIYNEDIGIFFNLDITFACFENINNLSSSETSVYSEKAIEKARENLKETIFVSDDFMNSITSDLLINYRLVNAVKDKDLFPYYQPIHDIRTGKVYAVEILARWSNEGEVISAFKFIDIINRLKVVDLLDMQMLEKAHDFYDRLIQHNERNKKLTFTFNASKLSLTKFGERKDEWEKLISNSNIPKEKLILELTEEIKIDDEIKESIDWMNENNLFVAVDDYGSGESNISSLADPIIDFVKLDMSVLPKDKSDVKKNLILESFVSMFHRLGKSICIEGVETTEQLEIVKENDIELAQGFLFSEPLSGEQLIEYLDSFDEI